MVVRLVASGSQNVSLKIRSLWSRLSFGLALLSRARRECLWAFGPLKAMKILARLR